jgi:integrase
MSRQQLFDDPILFDDPAGGGDHRDLTKRTCAALTLWLSRFPNAMPGTYIFPAYKVGVSGDKREVHAYGFNPEKPIGDWGKAWDGACSRATKKLREDSGESAVVIQYRWHDLRHTFITRLLENPAVSEQTVMALAGHVSKAMLARYSHIRQAAKQAAIATLERGDFQSGCLKTPFEDENRQIEPAEHDAAKYLN